MRYKQLPGGIAHPEGGKCHALRLWAHQQHERAQESGFLVGVEPHDSEQEMEGPDDKQLRGRGALPAEDAQGFPRVLLEQRSAPVHFLDPIPGIEAKGPEIRV